MVRSDLETFRPQTQREVNCGQIFAKGPILTKEIFEKVNNELVPKKTNLCGRQLKTKRMLYITGLLILLSVSSIATISIWFTDSYDRFVLSFLVISDNSTDSYKMWQKPPLKLVYKFHLFNYTNVKEFEDRMERKLRVNDVGPYVFEESMEKVNVVFNANNTISYQVKRTLTFNPKLTKGRLNDMLTVPNLPLFVGTSKVKDQNYFARLAFSGILTGLDEKPFLTMSANSFLTGYHSDIYELARNFNDEPIPEELGLLSGRKGLDPNVYTLNTGADDISKLGSFERYAGKENFDYFMTDECNRIDSSDGSFYPPRYVQSKEELSFLLPFACRRMPLKFTKETKLFNGKIPAYQYNVPDDIYDSADDNPSNQCYCSPNGSCPPKGLLNATACNMGVPLFISHPHFRDSDPIVTKYIDGLRPEKYSEKNYVNVHPFMGFALTGRSFMQVNLQVRKAYGVSQVDRFEEGTFLPISWVEAIIDEDHLGQQIIDVIFEATFTVERVRLALKFGTLLTTLITFISLCLIFLRDSRCEWLDRLRRMREPEDDDELDSINDV